MEDLSDPVAIGVVVTPHGVRGTLRVRALGAGKHLREGTQPVVAGVRRRISSAKQSPKGFLLDLEGVESRTDAQPLRGEQLFLDREELDSTEEGEFYVTDLVGLTAVGDAGEVLGTVTDTFETAAHEVLVVREEKGRQDLYVPFTMEHVPQVDLQKGRIVVRPPEGL
ncbi:MAG TPA: ribosome maturation factor RimM [Rubrobacter sp.]|nr:ribosome maturation factor RimM [Rubrobacter sp.]